MSVARGPDGLASRTDLRPGTRPETRPEIRPLTGLRFVAAMWVVLFHAPAQLSALLRELAPLDFLVVHGYLAVPLFFALSGYILSYQHYQEFRDERRDYPRFIAKRLARIYPVHLAMLLGLVVVVAAARATGTTVGGKDAYDLGGAVQDLLLVRGWVTPSEGWNFPAWSLSAEWFAYLTFPLAVAAVAACRSRPLRLLALAGALLAVRVGYVALSGTETPHPLIDVTTMFVAGVAVFSVLAGRGGSRAADLVGGGALILLIAATPFLGGSPAVQAAAMVLSLVVVGALGMARGIVAGALSWGPIAWGGRISMCIYLTHNPVATVAGPVWSHIGVDADSSPVARLLVGGLWLVLIVAAGAAAHYWIERPGQRLVMRLFQRVRDRRATTADRTPPASEQSAADPATRPS